MKNKFKLMAAAAVYAVALMTAGNVKAQSTTPANAFRFGIGLDAGVPTNLGISDFDLGGTARLQYGVTKGLALTLTSGYYNFFAKNGAAIITATSTSITTTPAKDQGLVPVKAGIKAYISEGWYFSGEAGAGFETSNTKNTKLILSPGLGYSTHHWDTGVRYESFMGQSNNYGLVNIRVAYGFGL